MSAIKACIWCGEEIKAGARICRHCNREQEVAAAEVVIYDGPGLLPIASVIVHACLMCVGIGLVTLPLLLLEHSRRTYKVTTRRIEMSSGLLSQRVEVLDLFRVRDVRFESSFGRGQIQILSSDVTTPRLTLAVPNARAVFDQLQPAIGAARSAANVRVSEHG